MLPWIDDNIPWLNPQETTTQADVSAVYPPGDVDGNGRITAGDARITLRASAYLQGLSPEQVKAADVDADGRVSAKDARQILRFSARLITSF